MSENEAVPLLVDRLKELGNRPADESSRGRIGSYITACQYAAAALEHLQSERDALAESNMAELLANAKLREALGRITAPGLTAEVMVEIARTALSSVPGERQRRS